MKSGGIGVIHYSNINSKQGWKKFQKSIRPPNLKNRRLAREFSVMTQEIMTKFLTDLGFEPQFSKSIPARDLITVFKNP